MDNPYPICENCIFVDEPIEKDPCRECYRAFLAKRIKPNFVKKHKPITNGDSIRAKSDEELADWLEIVNSTSCAFAMRRNPCHGIGCPCWLSWLKEEVEDG